jgi:hypothetical protein
MQTSGIVSYAPPVLLTHHYLRLATQQETARTGVTADAAGGASGGEEDEDVAEELDVELERIPLLGSKLLVLWVELDPVDLC